MITVLRGDAREILPSFAADSFDCIVTSPPYYGLRDYGCDSQIGLEPALAIYLGTMVAVCRELRRVLKPSGVFFLNIGDSYASGAGKVGVRPGGGKQGDRWAGFRGERAGHEGKHAYRVGPMTAPNRMPQEGLKPKDLMLIPERLGIALQEDGWWVRSRIVWHKLNPMPESVADRPTSAHETIWMLTRSELYFWDAEAVKEQAIKGNAGLSFHTGKTGTHQLGRSSSKERDEDGSRNLRNVWSCAAQPFSGAHFAAMPAKIAERCIKAGCPAGGRVLDPFGGSGTTGLAADRLGRDCMLIDLNARYAEMAAARIRDDAPLFVEVAG